MRRLKVDVKELSQSFSMSEQQENVSSLLARIIPNLDASGERLAAVEKLLLV